VIVKTAWPSLVPAIEKAGHKALIVDVTEFRGQEPRERLTIMEEYDEADSQAQLREHA
jgi:hypothetical protein